MCLHQVRLPAQSLAVFGCRLGPLSLGREYTAQSSVRPRRLRIGAQHVPQLCRGSGEISCLGQSRSQIVACAHKARSETNGPLIFPNRLGLPARLGEGQAEVVVHLGGIGTQSQGLVEMIE